MRALYEVQLSKNFFGREFRCKGDEEGEPCCCHGAVSVDRNLVSVLQAFREFMGSPVSLTNAYRCDSYNEAVGGHPRSFHRIGQAADITSIQIRKDLVTAAENLGAIVEDVIGVGRGNVIVYDKKRMIHVDAGHRVDTDLVRFK